VSLTVLNDPPGVSEAPPEAATVSHSRLSLVPTVPEIIAAVALVVQPINSTGTLSDYVSPSLKAATASAALGAVLLALVRERRRSHRSAGVSGSYVVAVLLIGLYLTWVIGVGLALYHLPVQRDQLALQAVFVVVVCVLLDRLRVGGMFVAAYWASAVLLVIGVVSGASSPWQGDSARASAGMHPITLGLTAAFVLVSSAIVFRGRSLALRLVVSALAGLALLLSFSRTAIVLTAVAVFVLWMSKIDRYVVARYLLGLWLALVGVVLIPGKIVSFLAQGDPNSLTSGTGRTVIWARIWAFRSEFQAHGYGFAALNDVNGPDLALQVANRGENAENALLQAFVMGGYVGAALWLLAIGYLVVFCLRGTGRRGEMVALLVTVLGGALTVHSLSGFGHPWTLLLAMLSFAMVRRRDPSGGVSG
jgi:O-antigen ligase